jgi:hypothetical protein
MAKLATVAALGGIKNRTCDDRLPINVRQCSDKMRCIFALRLAGILAYLTEGFLGIS